MFSIEFNWQKAEAELAYELQAAKTKQRLKEEEMQIQVVERAQQILVQEQEILRKEKELDAKVRRPAEAEKFKCVRRNLNRLVLKEHFIPTFQNSTVRRLPIDMRVIISKLFNQLINCWNFQFHSQRLGGINWNVSRRWEFCAIGTTVRGIICEFGSGTLAAIPR